MESYQQIKARHQKEVDAFPIGACFSNQQLAEMMKKFGLPNDKSGYAQIVSLGAGCYIMKKDVPAWIEMMRRHEKELREMRKDRNELKEAIKYQLRNHEYQISHDELQREAALNACGLTWKEVEEDPELLKLYKQAYKEFWDDCIKNDWF